MKCLTESFKLRIPSKWSWWDIQGQLIKLSSTLTSLSWTSTSSTCLLFLYFKMKKNRFLQYLNCAYVLITLPFDTLLLDEQLGQICACLHTYLFSNRACMYHRETYPTKHWTSDRYAVHVYTGSVGP